MSLLDTFTILFEADTSSVEQGADRSRKSSDELVDSLKKADHQASKTGNSFASFAAKAVGALTAAVGIGQTISSVMARAGDVHLMNQTAESIGVAVEEMDAFRRTVEDTGGTAQGAQDTVAKMASAMGAALKEANSSQGQTFAALGVSLKTADGQAKDAMSTLMDVAGALEGMSKAEARFALKRLEITDPKTVELLLKGRKEIEASTKAHKEQGVVTKEMAIQAGRLDTAMNKMRGGLDRAGLGITNVLLPAIVAGIEWLTKIVDWANEHSDVVVAFFSVIAGVVMAMYLPAMIKAAAATLAATWPMLAIGAAIVAVAAAFALAYDDIMNFIAGNDSFIGQIFEKYPMVKDLVFGLIDAFKTMGNAIAAVFKFIAAMWKAQFDFIMAGIEKVKSGVKTVASFFGFGDDDEGEEGGAQPRGEKVKAGVVAGKQALAQANTSPLNATTSNSISNSVASSRETNVQVGEVIVQTQATDANGIARDVGGSLDSQLKQMNNEFADGVER